MQDFLIVARIVHFASAISLMGIFAFETVVAGPALRQCGVANQAAATLRRRIWWLAWACLGFVVASSVAWIIAVAASMSGDTLAATLSQGVVGVVLTQTRIGEVWLLRYGLAALLALCLFFFSARRVLGFRIVAWAALVFSALLLVSLAWAGHGAVTVGPAGDLHLGADILHLFAVGFWLGTLPPLALLLVDARRIGDASVAAAARTAARRFSKLGLGSVIVLFASGLVNTWFLAGTIPALVGTVYGRLLLAKITLFLVMLIVAAVNLFRLTPRLAAAGSALTFVWRTIAQLRRNAVIETVIGFAIVCIVGVLGIEPPGLHTQPGWPFPFRFNIGALTLVPKIWLVILGAIIIVLIIVTTAAAAGGRYRRAAVLGVMLALCAAIAWVQLAPTMEPAHPTTFYAPAVPYNAGSVAQGAALYARNCAVCHGDSGRGDGPGAAGLPIRPANLVDPRILLARTPGDLFWSVSNGRANGAMPGFANAMTPNQRWDVVNFIGARAAGVLSRGIGSEVTEAAPAAVPDFTFEANGAQSTLDRALMNGPVLLVIFATDVPSSRLQQIAAPQPQLTAAGLRVIAVGLGGLVESAPTSALPKSPYVVGVSPEASATLALFRSADDGGETELMLDRSGYIRARWTANGPGGLAPLATLVGDAKRVARSAAAAPDNAGMGGMDMGGMDMGGTDKGDMDNGGTR